MKKYFYVVSGWMIYHSGHPAPLRMEIATDIELRTSSQYYGIRIDVIKTFKLMDFLMFNVMELENDLTDEELAVFNAEDILAKRQAAPPNPKEGA